MTVPATGASLEGAALVLSLVLMAYLMVGEPLVGRAYQMRFLTALRAGDSLARLRLYRTTIVWEWTLALAVLLLVLAADGLDRTDVGLAGIKSWDAAAPVLGGVAGVLIEMLCRAGRARRKGGSSAPPVVGGDSVVAMLPRTRAERWTFGGMAVTAGVCEELLFRGFMLAVFAVLVPPSAPGWALLVTGAVIFAFAHAYQGVAGVFVTGLLGLALGAIYLLTGSLLIPVLLHALLDLRAVLLPVPAMAIPAQVPGDTT